MTEPDEAAALAAQIGELRGQLARCQGEVGHLRARLEEDSGHVLMLRLEIKQLAEKLDEAIAFHKVADPPAPFWLGLSREEHAARLGEVREWVERVARVQYPGYLERLAPCWANHREAVWELSNLMTEWARVYGDPDNRPLGDALWFHERWMPGVLSRLALAVKCDAVGCRMDAQRPWQRSPPRYT
jgi:regulator of replication initiation timing